MNVPLIIVFYEDVASVKKKLTGKSYSKCGCGDPASFTPTGAPYSFVFYKAPADNKDKDSIMIGMRPFELSIAGVMIDDSVKSIISQSLIVAMSNTWKLPTPEIIHEFN